MQAMLRDTPLYEVLTMDKSNLTPLGMVVLWAPYVLLAVMATIAFVILFALIMVFVLPMAGLGWCLGQLDERFDLSTKANKGLCKLSTGLKLLRRC